MLREKAAPPTPVVGALPSRNLTRKDEKKVATVFGQSAKGESNSEFRTSYKPRRKTKEDRELRQRFAEVDQDGDGSIDAIELADALKRMGRYESEAQVQRIIEAIDINGDGRVQLREMMEFLMKPEQKQTEEETDASELATSICLGDDGKLTMGGLSPI